MFGMKQITNRSFRPYLLVFGVVFCVLLQLSHTNTERDELSIRKFNDYSERQRLPSSVADATQLSVCESIKPKQDGLQYPPKLYTDVSLTWPEMNPKKMHRRLHLDIPRTHRRVQNCSFPFVEGVTHTRSFERQLNDPIIRAIERIQNPRDCRSVGYDIHVGHYAGLGSQLHVAGRRMLGANTHGRVFILNHETDTLLGAGFTASQTFCEESGVHGFECYFQTLSNCTEYGSSAEAESVEISGRKLTGNRDRLAPLKDHTDFQGITSNTKESVRLQRAYATEYMLRPNTRFQHKLELMYSQVFDAGVVPPKLISVNIRWGDKWSEMLLNPIERYVGTVADLVRLHYNKDEAVIVFLQTWEQDAHDHFHRLSPKAWDVRSFAFDRSLNPHDTEGARSPNSTTISLCSMYIAADAMFHVGTRDSNWDRLIDELRITRGFHRPSSLMVDLSESGGDMRDNP